MSAEPAAASRPSRGQQRRARSLALQTLYEVDLSGHAPADVLDRLTEENLPSATVLDYTRQILAGVARHRREIDELIRRHAPAWPLDQMATIDRNILRLGIFEAWFNSTTIGVGMAINEAVELAKQFGSATSSRFVNGVLGQIAAERGPSPPRGASSAR
jgi:N utilization substance protein B